MSKFPGGTNSCGGRFGPGHPGRTSRAPGSLEPAVAPFCPLAATKDVFKRAWELASDETAALLCAAEKAHGALDGVKLGSHRELTVAEAPPLDGDVRAAVRR